MSSLDVNCVNPNNVLDIVHLNMVELQVLYSRLLKPPTPGLYVGLISFRLVIIMKEHWPLIGCCRSGD